MTIIKIKKIHPKAIVPKIATKGSACFDFCACENFVLGNGHFYKARTGIIFEVPKGWHIKVYNRSGMAARGIIIPNAPGIIDSDYRGEVIVLLYGLFMKKQEIFQISSRIAQGELISKLSDTERGSGGFGSTGK